MSDLKREQKVIDTLKSKFGDKILEAEIQNPRRIHIKVADPEADLKEIIKTARKEGITDMRVAYNRTYEKRLTQAKIDEEVEKRVKEIEDKNKVTVMNTRGSSGRQVLKVKRK